MGSKKDPAKEAAKVQKQQLARLNNISLPELEQLALESPELVGLLDTEQLDDSAMEDVNVDPSLMGAQRAALEDLQERGKLGLTAEDRARLNQTKRETESDNQARQKQILQGMAERGNLDSGSQLIAQLQSAGQSNQDAALAGERLAAEASSARRQALSQSGQLAGQMAQQQFGQDAQKSQAKDAINQFNLNQRANTAQTNLGARQNIENQRAGIANQNQSYNKQIVQQNFQNEMSKAGAQGQATNALAQSLAAQQAGPSLGQKIGTIGGAIAGGLAGGPKGVSEGASAGGTIGGIFADGGIIHAEDGFPKEENFLDTLRQSSNLIPTPSNYVEKEPELIAPRKAPRDNYVERLSEPAAEAAPVAATVKEEMPAEKSKSKMPSLEDLGKIAAAAQKTGPEDKPLNLDYGTVDYKMPANALNPGKAMQFANPFAAEDGGIADMEALNGLEAMLSNKDFISSGKGDIIDSGMDSYANDRVDAKVNDGEAILNVPQQQRLMDMIRGEIAPQELGDGDIIEGVPRDYRDKLHNKIDRPEKKQKSDKEKKIEGLENLLKALGK